jgi:hypothetical protein
MESKLGNLITKYEDRDAVHTAIAPVIAGEHLKRGERISITKGIASRKMGNNHVGIVDPFLPFEDVKEGDKFWACLYPNSIVSLRHHWSHPAFPPNEDNSSEKLEFATGMIKKWAEEAGLDYDTIMYQAGRYLVDDYYYVCEGGRWEGFYVDDTFWDAYEVVTGTVVSSEKRGSWFSCSC